MLGCPPPPAPPPLNRGGLRTPDTVCLCFAADLTCRRSTLKHFAAYSQESGRVNDPVVVSARDMEDTYLPAFEAGVKHGHAAGLMCSYNAETFGYASYGNASVAPGQYSGVPSCANEGLLRDLARGSWGFDGCLLQHIKLEPTAIRANRSLSSTSNVMETFQRLL